MACPISFTCIFLILALFHQVTVQAGAGQDLIFEDGYKVFTVIDGDKSNIKVNPYSIIHQSPPSDLFILLDSVASTFYTVSLPTTSNETVIKRLAGNGEPGYVDGDLVSARFNKPRSFAVDLNGNVYVADMHNRAIRKITKSGVTTIAGGYPQKAVRTDVPASDASLSNNFELTFIPQICALMISDHGNRLIHQINLKAADCKTHTGSVLGTTSVWLLGLGFSCLLSLIVGFVLRPYVYPYEGRKPLHSRWTWTHYLMNLERQIATFCSVIRSVVVKSTVYSLFKYSIMLSLSHLSLMFRPVMLQSRTTEKSVSLLDLDDVYSSSSSSSSSKVGISSEVDDQIKALLGFDGGLMMSPVNGDEVAVQEEKGDISDVSTDEIKKLDGMIAASLVKFEEQALIRDYSDECSLGLVKRR